MSVAKYLDSVARRSAETLRSLISFALKKGEDLKRKEDNFADEVASMM